MRLGFVGLGQMGRPIAHNLLKSGAELIVSDRTDRWFGEFRDKGVTTTTNAADLAETDILFLCLPNTEVVQSFLLGESGVIARLRQGQTVVDLSTIGYNATVEVGRALEAKSVAFLDAPISGMEARAIEGTLTVMCGGERAVFERVRPYLDCIGNKILYMGPTGSGQLTKLINQLLFDINAAALGEILPMAAKMGLDPDLVGEVVNSGTGRSYASEFFVSRILRGHFGDGYPMAHAYKDLVSGAELGANQGIPMPVLAAATATYQAALLRGHGEKDKGGMVRVFEELLGVRVPQPHRPSLTFGAADDRQTQGPRQRPDQLRRSRLRPLPAPLLRPLDGPLPRDAEQAGRRHRHDALRLQQLPPLHARAGRGGLARRAGRRRPAARRSRPSRSARCSSIRPA